MDNAFAQCSLPSPDDIVPAPVSAQDEAAIVSPVPPDAPPLDVTIRHRKPDELVWFLNEKGEALFAECRWNFDGGVKEVRPACLTNHGWKLTAYPALRPLYNLNKVTARPHLRVVAV